MLNEKELTPEQIKRICEETEEKLAKEGLAPVKSIAQEIKEAGLESDSLEDLAEMEEAIKKGLDDAIVTENLFSSEIPLNKCGLPPCQRAKLEDERNIKKRDPRLDRE